MVQGLKKIDEDRVKSDKKKEEYKKKRITVTLTKRKQKIIMRKPRTF